MLEIPRKETIHGPNLSSNRLMKFSNLLDNSNIIYYEARLGRFEYRFIVSH